MGRIQHTACVRLRLRQVGYVETLPKLRVKAKNKNEKNPKNHYLAKIIKIKRHHGTPETVYHHGALTIHLTDNHTEGSDERA